MRTLLEIAVSTPAEAVAAVRAGADRLELAAALELGGLTPSFGIFARVRALVAVPIYVLLRPRPGGFCYSDAELESLLLDADIVLSGGADGVVFGALDEAGNVAADACVQMVEAAKGRAVFHRAFDFTPDPVATLDRLIALGFERVLTSGAKPTAHDGAATIADLIARAAGRIEIIPGGGIRPDNVARLVRSTHCTQVHSSARSLSTDRTLLRNSDLARGMGAANLETATTDPELVAGLRSELDRLAASVT